MIHQPLVTVICICYNHAAFVKDALDSILAQTYKNIEIIVCDDASADNSQAVIEQYLKNLPAIIFIKQRENRGNCRLFNQAFQLAKGDYIIDLAADDLLMPDRVAKGIEYFLQAKSKVGVQYCKVHSIDKDGKPIAVTSPKKEGKTGDLYLDFITDYIVNPAGMMMKRNVLEKLNGYDEQLTYEDFDFWIRSARDFDYDFIDEILVKKRKLRNSLSSNQFKIWNNHGKSTFLVCKNIFELNNNKIEDIALIRRVKYEFWQSIKTLNFLLAVNYLHLLKEVKTKIQKS